MPRHLKKFVHQTCYRVLSLLFLIPAFSFAQNTEDDAVSNNLIAKSPFLPPGYGVQEKTPAPAPVAKPVVSGQLSKDLEFRGVFQLGDSPPRFSIFDKKEQKGYWIELEGSTDRFDIVEFKEKSGSIIVSAAGQREEIFMAKSDGSPLSIAGANLNTSSNQTPKNPQINPSSNNTNRRVIPRRRIIRRRTNTNNAAPPPPPLPVK